MITVSRFAAECWQRSTKIGQYLILDEVITKTLQFAFCDILNIAIFFKSEMKMVTIKLRDTVTILATVVVTSGAYL